MLFFQRAPLFLFYLNECLFSIMRKVQQEVEMWKKKKKAHINMKINNDPTTYRNPMTKKTKNLCLALDSA